MVTKKVTKGFKTRIYPTYKQKQIIEVHFDACHELYNHFLALQSENHKNGKKHLSHFDMCEVLTSLKKEQGYDRFGRVGSRSALLRLKDLSNAFNRFFDKKLKDKYPTFKKRKEINSFSTYNKVLVDGNKLFCEKFRKDNYIKMAESDKIHDKIKILTISKTPTGKYFASFCFKTEHEILPKTGVAVGIDTGIKNLAILSDGSIFENLRPLKKAIAVLKYESKQLSKKQKGSNRREVQRKKLARVHERICNIRNSYIHQVTSAMVKKYEFLAVEDLNVKGMVKNHKLARALNDVSLGRFYTFLKYKSEWNDRDYGEIDRFFPSSKMCNNCKTKNDKLTLGDRSWKCENCGQEHDRDVNASINILTEGLRLMSGSTSESEVKEKCGEAVNTPMNRNPMKEEKAYTK